MAKSRGRGAFGQRGNVLGIVLDFPEIFLKFLKKGCEALEKHAQFSRGRGGEISTRFKCHVRS